ncbi:hypothetical protein [Amycolatopsis palatopharyngis]|uniref:hypothetical protein n=1 Tax=Amycolatopsis palatopharyngis TaxID=187982 RepID=UPI0013BE8C90|nr:hypothetical protein [Amycolatopsis palatopharyngis]
MSSSSHPVFDDQSTAGDAPAVAVTENGGPLRHLFSGALGLLATPAGLGLVGYGSGQIRRTIAELPGEAGVTGAVAMVAGGLVLLGVALLGRLSPAGPLAGGLVWGILPGLFVLAFPLTAFRITSDLLDLGELGAGALGLLLTGGILATGMALTGAGISSALARRNQNLRARAF